MKIRQVVHLPILVQAVDGGLSLAVCWHCRVCAEDDHVETSWRRIVDPFRRKCSDRV